MIMRLNTIGLVWFMVTGFSAVADAGGQNVTSTDVTVRRPNVILIMTDDQGYGDIGVNGNPILKTPALDTMAAQSARIEYFYVCPVCTPTRASLMTGRYNYRTRAIDTYRGRAMMDPGEVTIADILRGAGYATGIFGKWHLGDNYPMRPQDKGFDEVLVHRGGGIAQPGDPPGGEGKYTDPVLFRNGKTAPMKGYCTDVYFTEGMKWAESAGSRGRPFFLYLATNAPHGPYHDVPPDKYEYYKKQVISPDRFPATPGHPIARNLNADNLARVYAMISNIDDNVGRLFAWLDKQKLKDNTLVIFLTDNGEASVGYNAGLRGRKSDVYEGGIRTPFFVCWPGRLQPRKVTDHIAAHIDVLPTILEACGVCLPQGLKIDGRSILSLLKGQSVDWTDRTLFFQSHRGDHPVLYHNCAVRTERWKLVHNSGFGKEQFTGDPKFELFDMVHDPYETRDVAADHRDIVEDLKHRYEAWFADVSSTRPDNYAPPRICLGTAHEDPTVLTRQDWRGANWSTNDCGHWEVLVTQPGRYDVKLLFKPLGKPGKAQFKLGQTQAERDIAPRDGSAVLEGVELPAGPANLEAWVIDGPKRAGVMFVEVSRRP
jgi:arylsulfatase A-like enzyme